MNVIRANTSDFQLQLAEIDKMERDALIPREIAKLKSTGKQREMEIENIKKIKTLELRKKYPDFMLPPIEVGISSTDAPHPDYHCPYCYIVLADDSDTLTCKSCSPKRVWLKE
jgi:hypothetical protein